MPCGASGKLGVNADHDLIEVRPWGRYPKEQQKGLCHANHCIDAAGCNDQCLT